MFSRVDKLKVCKSCGLDLIRTSLAFPCPVSCTVTPMDLKCYHMTAVLSYTFLHLLVIDVNNHICFRTIEVQAQHALDQTTQMRVLHCTVRFEVLFQVQSTKVFLYESPTILLLIQ